MAGTQTCSCSAKGRAARSSCAMAKPHASAARTRCSAPKSRRPCKQHQLASQNCGPASAGILPQMSIKALSHVMPHHVNNLGHDSTAIFLAKDGLRAPRAGSSRCHCAWRCAATVSAAAAAAATSAAHTRQRRQAARTPPAPTQRALGAPRQRAPPPGRQLPSAAHSRSPCCPLSLGAHHVLHRTLAARALLQTAQAQPPGSPRIGAPARRRTRSAAAGRLRLPRLSQHSALQLRCSAFSTEGSRSHSSWFWMSGS